MSAHPGLGAINFDTQPGSHILQAFHKIGIIGSIQGKGIRVDTFKHEFGPDHLGHCGISTGTLGNNAIDDQFGFALGLIGFRRCTQSIGLRQVQQFFGLSIDELEQKAEDWMATKNK